MISSTEATIQNTSNVHEPLATVADAYNNPKSEQSFREALKATLLEAGIELDEPVRIQFGRKVILEGNLDDPNVTQLSDPQLVTMLDTALDLAPKGNSQSESSSPQRGVLSIDVGERRVLHVERGQVKINELQPVRSEQREQANQQIAASIGTVIESVLTRSEDELRDIARASENFDTYRENWNRTHEWLEDAVKTDPDLQNFAQQFPGQFEKVTGKMLERLEQIDQKMNTLQPQMQEFDRKTETAQSQKLFQAITTRTTDVVNDWAEKLKIPAAVTALREFYNSNLSPTTQKWAKTAMEPMHRVAGLVLTICQSGH
jgi:hypothetical protein